VDATTYEVWFYPLSSRVIALKEGYSSTGMPFSRLRSFSLKSFRRANAHDIKVNLWLKQIREEIEEFYPPKSF
jgi:hypothetical protein